MKKGKVVFIISFLILLSIAIYSTFTYIQQNKRNNEIEKEDYEFCESIDYKNTKYKEHCENVIESINVKTDFFTMYTNVLLEGFLNISFVLCLFLIIPSLCYISGYFKNNMISEEITRTSYSKIKMKLFKKSYYSVLILPAVIIITFLICGLYTKSFDVSYALKYGLVPWSESSLKYPTLFIFCYILNIIIHSILYVNIGICIVRKYHNYFVAVILSFLTFIGIEAILEVLFSGIICTTILKNDLGIYFNIMNMISFNDSKGLIMPLVVPFILMIISFVAIHFLYKDKEKLIIDCEQA